MICQGDHVKFVSTTVPINVTYGTVTSKRHGLVGVCVDVGTCAFGDYEGWSGTEFFLPGQLTILPDLSGRPRGRVLFRAREYK